jgi:hypothetical protein
MNLHIDRRHALGIAAGLAITPWAGSAAPRFELRGHRKIWDAAQYNSFTDLARRQDEWFCVFREGTAHVSPDGALRVLVSKDGETWKSAARMTYPGGDLRDAKITVTPSGKLMLCGAVAYPKGSKPGHQSLAWFSDDGRMWSEAAPIGQPDYWLWRVTWRGTEAYGVGYGTAVGATRGTARLYRSGDGKAFDVLVPELFTVGYPNEASLLFQPDGTALCLLRRDAGPLTGQLGVAKPPYKQWEWRDVGARIGGPALIELPDGRLIAVVRLYDGKVRTAVCSLDAATGKLTEALTLPSGGDCSYAGLVWHDNLLWVSYYSSHEGKTSIYLAKVAVG